MGALTSKVSSKSQTVIPRSVREKLGLQPGDRLAYRITDEGVMIEKQDVSDDIATDLYFDPLVWWEWATPEEDEAWAYLQPKR